MGSSSPNTEDAEMPVATCSIEPEGKRISPVCPRIEIRGGNYSGKRTSASSAAVSAMLREEENASCRMAGIVKTVGSRIAINVR